MAARGDQEIGYEWRLAFIFPALAPNPKAVGLGRVKDLLAEFLNAAQKGEV